MESLNYLKGYDSENSDSESETPSNPNSPNVQKTSVESFPLQSRSPPKRKLPPPNLTSMGKKKEMESDDPNKHEGRIRSFPHVRGNWASFVYIPFSHQEELMDKVLNILKQSFLDFPRDDGESLKFMLNEEFHLSLTKTQIFRHHWIESFIASLKKIAHGIKQFQLVFNCFKIFVNEEKTRTFISLEACPTEGIMKVLKHFDNSLSDFQLLPFYEDPSFHISLGWILGNQFESLNSNLIPILNSKWRDLIEEDVDIQFSIVDRFEFKTGTKVYQFPLFE